MILNLRKSRIQYFKRIAIRSRNEGDMANWSNATQRACCYGIAYGSNSFWVFGLNFGPFLLGSFLVAIGPFGFSIFTNPIFGCKTIFYHLDFIQILITKYATRYLKAMRNILFNFFFVFVICSWLIAYVVLRYFGTLYWK